MAVKILTKETEPAVSAVDWATTESVLKNTHAEAAAEDFCAYVTLTSDDGYELGIVVGGELSVLSYQTVDGEPPYMVSLGAYLPRSDVVTAYGWFTHHTEFPGHYAIPLHQALSAAKQFVEGQRPPDAAVWQLI